MNPRGLPLSNDTTFMLIQVLHTRSSEIGFGSWTIRLAVENTGLRQDLDAVRDDLIIVTDQVDELAQYSRRNTLRVTNNWEEQPGESTDALVMTMAKNLLDLTLTEQDIGRSHRVGRKPLDGSSRSIVSGFTSYRARQKLFKVRGQLRKAGPTAKGIYINEHLTPKRARLAKDARALKAANVIVDTWSHDGKIFVKDKGDKIIVVSNERELARLRPRADTPAANGR